jgi:hypothetical protein
MVSNMKTLTLTHKTRKAKQRLNQHGAEWRALKSSPTVQFSSFIGPWLFIESLKTKSTRWIHRDNDKDFLIVKDKSWNLSMN